MRAAAFAALALAAGTAHGGANSLTFLNAIPTLDEVGLGLLIALVAGAAGWAVRRRSARK
jgi:hypothetical protein